MSRAEARLRCIRLISIETGAKIHRDLTFRAQWLKRHIPKGITLEERWLWPLVGHTRWSNRFANTVHAVEKTGLSRKHAQRLVRCLFQEAAAYDAWCAVGRPDEAANEQKRQAKAHRGTNDSLARAATLLANHLATATDTSTTMAVALADLEVAEKIIIDDPFLGPEHDGSFEAVANIYQGWKREDGEPPGAPIARYLRALSKQLYGDLRGGPAAFRYGPWQSLTTRLAGRPGKKPEDTTAAAFLATALARGAGLDWPLAMPSTGQPAWALAVTFAGDLTRTTVDADRIQENVHEVLTRAPDIMFRGWSALMPYGWQSSLEASRRAWTAELHAGNSG